MVERILLERILFASDLHARPDAPERENKFKRFLTKAAMHSKSLYLLGDIFEFGFVFREEVLPYYEPLIDDLEFLVDSGVQVKFLGGNHDLWMVDYLYKRGIEILHDGQVLELMGRKLQLFHGILVQPDPLSRFADRIMKNPDAVWLYSRIRPSTGFRLALKAAVLSQTRHRPFPRSIVSSTLKEIDPDVDVVISGHHHDHVEFRYRNQLFFSTGNFFADYSYLELTPRGLKRKFFPG